MLQRKRYGHYPFITFILDEQETIRPASQRGTPPARPAPGRSWYISCPESKDSVRRRKEGGVGGVEFLWISPSRGWKEVDPAHVLQSSSATESDSPRPHNARPCSDSRQAVYAAEPRRTGATHNGSGILSAEDKSQVVACAGDGWEV